MIGRRPPATEHRPDQERLFRELQQRDTEMRYRYERATQITGVRTYRAQRIYEALSSGDQESTIYWICGHCRHGDLGYQPQVGDICPGCCAKVEEVLRSPREHRSIA